MITRLEVVFLLVQLHEVLTFDNKTYMCLSARVLVYRNVNLQAFDFFVIFFFLQCTHLQMQFYNVCQNVWFSK